MTFRLTRAVFAFALLLASFVAHAQNYCFSVKVIGHGKPVILIPGLTCSGDVWNGTVDQLKSNYECHVLTLPGMGGQKPIDGPYLTHVRDDIIAYVEDNKLNHPAVIGHSLGGFMVYFLAIKEPKMWGPLVAVDGLPFLSALFDPKATPESMQKTADAILKQLSSATPDQFKAGILASLKADITDPKNVEMVYKTASMSDPRDVGEAMSEMLTTDLRPDVHLLVSPLMLIGAAQAASTEDSRKMMTNAYSDQMKGIVNGALDMDLKARHFVMLDDPDGFYRDVKQALSWPGWSGS